MACGPKSIFKDAEVIRVKKFPVTLSNVEEQLPVSSIGINTVFIADTFLLIKHFERDFILRVYSAVSQKYQTNLLYVGHGPDELLDFSYLDQYKRDSSGVKLYFEDINQLKYFELNLTESCRLKSTVLREITSFPVQYLCTFYFDDTTYLSRDYDGYMMRILYGIHDGSGVIRKDWVLYEEVKNQDFNRFWSADRLRPDGTKLAIAMSEFDQINILDLQGGKNLTLTTADRLPEVEKMEGNAPICYQAVATTQDRIYALHLDPEDARCEIQVFTWEGEPVYNLEISRLLRAFAVDAEGKQLYGVSREEEIFRYDLRQVE